MSTKTTPDAVSGADDSRSSRGATADLCKCWCGASGTIETLFSDEPYGESCGGTGVIYCECGGDGLCVCHHHGELECDGCEDCLDDDGFEFGYEDECCEPLY